MMKRLIIILNIFVLLNACNTKKEEQKETIAAATSSEVILTNAQIKNAGIVISVMQNNSISSNLKVNGKIDVPPQNLVSIGVPLGGYLKNTKLLPGMPIRKGEVIAKIEDQQYIQLQQDFLATQSKLHFSELEFKRQKELNQSKASSDKMTQQAEAEYRTNQILIASLKEKLKLVGINANSLSPGKIKKSISIFSPINGFVSKVNVNIGKYISPSEVMFELINPSDIHLNIKVYDKDVRSLAIGKKVLAYTNSNPETKYNCKIILINKDVSAEGTIDVHCHFENYNKTLLPGMYMNAEVAISQSNSNTLPEDAVVSFEGKDYVFIGLSNNKFRLQEVESGTAQSGFIAIRNAEAIKDKNIVIKGAYALLMKMKNTED